MRENACIKGWFSGHFHLSHDYEDSMTFPGGNNRGSCVFGQTAVMTARSTRDGRRQSRLIKGNKDGFEICTVNHAKGGEVRVDASVSYADGKTVVNTYEHEDLSHDNYFRSYTPQEEDGCYIENNGGVLNEDADWDENTVCWWHMGDGAVLGVHDGMIIEYDPTTLAPLGMVVSKDELMGRKVAVVDSGLDAGECNVFADGAECVEQSVKEQALILYDEDGGEVTVVQPNEDGSYWRKIVRNKMIRMQEARRVKAAKNFVKELKGEDNDVQVLSSWGPYTSTIGQVYKKNDLSLPAVTTRPMDSTKMPAK